MSTITFQSEKIKFSLRNATGIRNWIELVIKKEKRQSGHINYLFCSDNHLLKINQQYLKHTTLTDIITFDSSEGKIISGDILISIPRIKENARLFNVSFKDELQRVMIHGIMHLCGFKDKTAASKKEMTAKEDYYLSLRAF